MNKKIVYKYKKIFLPLQRDACTKNQNSAPSLKLENGESLTSARCNVILGLKPEFWFLVHASVCKGIRMNFFLYDIYFQLRLLGWKKILKNSKLNNSKRVNVNINTKIFDKQLNSITWVRCTLVHGPKAEFFPFLLTFTLDILRIITKKGLQNTLQFSAFCTSLKTILINCAIGFRRVVVLVYPPKPLEIGIAVGSGVKSSLFLVFTGDDEYGFLNWPVKSKTC
ncbi:hypothetical protein BpHYR1_031068 [Brachionus plicatilis]|uniref:Uncharacterized protein n=1 Tax=Brachionus plicatilis TaxID=10195 RepID=A0A3M7RX79_BRAPC|nr:hypothetical protein BpHYR1_031068 [Brachionus plicatilis]